MSTKLSVVISAYNSEDKIIDCLESVVNLADEIIFVDNSSTDKTADIAKKYTQKVFIRENSLMLNISKNFGFGKASSEWILSLDSDERVTKELSKEIRAIIGKNTDVSGYWIPRRNIIFGKWIKNAGWYPDKQLRLFRRRKGSFAEKHVHEMISVGGKVENLENNIEHLNYESIDQFLEKMNRYTLSEANNLMSNGYKINFKDIIAMPSSEFIKRYFLQRGYKDGIHGLALSLLMGFYHLVIFLKIWERNGFIKKESSLDIFKDGYKNTRKEISYWLYDQEVHSEKNIVKKIVLKIRRRIPL